jgi:predicted nucleotidyltransferase
MRAKENDAINLEKITAVRIFGSVARGEADANSDLDILVVTESDLELTEELRTMLGIPCSADVSMYSTKRLLSMFEQGHLFAWHIFLESTPFGVLSDLKWKEAFGKPNEYSNSSTDIRSFLTLLDDCEDAIKHGSDVIFEAGIYYLGLRNLGMILSHKLKNRPNFSRYSAMHLPDEIRPPIKLLEYEYLLACRRYSRRAVKDNTPDNETILKIIDKLKSWKEKLRNNYDFKI